ncbi:MAG: site-2 protease family protein [Anaerolineae bacterium]
MLLIGMGLAQLLATAMALLIAISVHEFSHALMADELGDSTPRSYGRLTLNPLAHLDPVGTLMMLFAGFGWGKPVPVNPYYLRNGPKAGMAMVSFAGPLSNLIVAALFAVPVRSGLITFSLSGGGVLPSLSQIIGSIIFFNVILAVFNLLPISPLDGFKVAIGLLPSRYAFSMAQLEPYGPMILILLILLGRVGRVSILWAIMGPPTSFLLRLMLGA